jgi:hypothetical protein
VKKRTRQIHFFRIFFEIIPGALTEQDSSAAGGFDFLENLSQSLPVMAGRPFCPLTSPSLFRLKFHRP